MKTKTALLSALMLVCVATSAVAQDPRIQIIPYETDKVISFYGCTTIQTMISFDADERIENVAVGDSQLWQVTPNKKADLLFVKALTSNGPSNMTVVTNRHHYIFELKNASNSDCKSGRTAYELRFSYPQREITVEQALSGDALLPMPEKRNSAYTYLGDVGLVPLRVFDDGVSTYMLWAEGVPTPAVFAKGVDGAESLVNFSNVGDYFVVGQLAPAFSLRLGTRSVVLYNDAYAVKGLDDLSPKPKVTNKR
jgi:type IV secretion system protein VirB9